MANAGARMYCLPSLATSDCWFSCGPGWKRISKVLLQAGKERTCPLQLYRADLVHHVDHRLPDALLLEPRNFPAVCSTPPSFCHPSYVNHLGSLGWAGAKAAGGQLIRQE